ncbi:glycosyltransferase family 4 protein [Anaerosporobacter faecicola]|uniref:glycosyltransferase family 4 protein n=1 Tax=Anaerosporobacter faecicola TaxID=2718714 RepID=UPI00143A84AE|nr:glycosyltransferase family 4 protein [Anaerosporobacter faecicola]
MKKFVLLVSTVSGFVPQFEMNNVKILQEMGYEVHYAANFHMPVYTIDEHIFEENHIVKHQIDFVRSPFRVDKNIKAYKQLTQLLKQYSFELIHCHTPMGGVLARLAARKSKETKVVYTAHGFHFFRGAPCLNWLLFYPVERLLARYTDCLITINEEDYRRAKQFKIRKDGLVRKINGVGIAIEGYKDNSINPIKLRKQFKIKEDSYLLISVGELTKRKNHAVVIQAMKNLRDKNIQYLICGSGEKEEEIRTLIKKLHLEEKVLLAGYCVNIKEILACADCFVFPSLQEGLPVALMEAMAAGLPVICSDIRGNRDLIKNGKGGFLVGKKDAEAFSNYINKIYEKNQKKKSSEYGKVNQDMIKKYQISYVDKQMRIIYENILSKQV